MKGKALVALAAVGAVAALSALARLVGDRARRHCAEMASRCGQMCAQLGGTQPGSRPDVRAAPHASVE